jgi:hypothetical protein
VASYHRQLRKPISSGILIARTIVGSLGEGWVFAAVVELGLFDVEGANAAGGTGLDVGPELAVVLPVRVVVALESR